MSRLWHLSGYVTGKTSGRGRDKEWDSRLNTHIPSQVLTSFRSQRCYFDSSLNYNSIVPQFTMSNERLFARNIPFAQGETQHDESVTGIQETRNSSTIGSSTHPASQGPRNQGESSRANADSSTIGGFFSLSISGTTQSRGVFSSECRLPCHRRWP